MSKLHWLTAFGLLLPTLASAQAPQNVAQYQGTEPQQPAQVLSRVVAGPPSELRYCTRFRRSSIVPSSPLSRR